VQRAHDDVRANRDGSAGLAAEDDRRSMRTMENAKAAKAAKN